MSSEPPVARSPALAAVRPVPDAWAADGSTVYLLRSSPGAMSSPAGIQVKAVVVLREAPHASRPDLAALVESGRLDVMVTVEPDASLLSVASGVLGLPCQPLPVEALALSLQGGKSQVPGPLGRAIASGATGRLCASLAAGEALALLRALHERTPSGLVLRARVTYRARQDATAEMSADAAALFEFLRGRVDDASEVSGAALGAVFPELLQSRLVTTVRRRGAAVPTDLLPIYEAFLHAAAPLLRPLPSRHPVTDGRSRFALGPSTGTLSWKTSQTGPVPTNIELAVAIEELWRGLDASSLLTVVTPAIGDPARLVPIARRVASSRHRAVLPSNAAERVLLETRGTRPQAVPLSLTPNRLLGPSAHALLASDVARPAGAHAWLAGDVVVEPALQWALLSLPVVDDAAAPLWRDRADASHRFYAPAPTLPRPQPGDAPAASAFLFRFERMGMTGGANPKPSLRAKVRFVVQLEASEGTRAALAAAGNPRADAVPCGNLSATLEIPFVIEGSGQPAVQSFAGTASLAGTVASVEVELLDDWVRLAYGALAYDGFQGQAARLSLAYAFTAAVEISTLRFDAALTGKIALTPVVSRPASIPERVDRPIVDASTRTVHLPEGQLRFGAERRFSAGTSIAAAALTTHVVVPPAAIEPPASATIPAAGVRYATRTVVHQESVEVRFPCDQYGAFYLEGRADGDVPVGCQDALKLGQIIYKQYDELPEFGADKYRVYRSLQQPGRFLVLPHAYRVARYAANDPGGRGYRPVAMIYALIGDSPGGTRYFFAATLEPDVPVHARRALMLALAPLAPHDTPVTLDFPSTGDAQSSASYQWAVPEGIDTPTVDRIWNSFQVSVSTDLQRGVVLKELIEHSGLQGSVRFALGDGTSLESQLVIDTTAVGPWEDGPVGLAWSGGQVTVRNHLSVPVDLEEVVIVRSLLAQHLPVTARLAPGESRLVDAGGTPETSWAIANARAAATLEELEVFEEDVNTNVVFIDQLNHASHELSHLAVALRTAGTEHLSRADLDEGQTVSLEVVFPLTTYLDAQVIELQFSKTSSHGEVSTTRWISWNLSSQGAVVGVTWDLIS
jgi:hypothetical protein